MLWSCLVISLMLCFSGSTARRNRYNFGVTPPHVEAHVKLPKAQWYNQILNHFDPTDQTTWQQRFYVNDQLYKSGGPIFLMIGGEGPATAEWMVTGAWFEYGKEFKAKLVQVEHRFYGQSHPTEDTSISNLRFLSSEQALADLAVFVTDFKEQQNMTSSKVIAFGGSYPGSLATWFRLKYPHIVHASIASSAPLVAQVDFKEYLEVVHDSIISKGSLKCLRSISKATVELRSLLAKKRGWKQIEIIFKLCSPFNGTDDNDVSTLFSLLVGNFEEVVQYNEDNRAFEGGVGANITIENLCDIMTQPKQSSLKKYGEVNSRMLRLTNQSCLDHTYGSMIKDLQKTKWVDDISGRTWTYQTCTEFGFYQSSKSFGQPFGHKFPVKYFIQQCSDIFGNKFTETLLNEGVKRTNIMYGGQNPQVSRVALINGSIDPWHKLGVTKSLSQDVPAIYINGTAHCANMYPPLMKDCPALKTARLEINKYIYKWLKE